MTDFPLLRERMVAGQLAARGIRNPAVLRAMEEVPREEFVPPDLREAAYDDGPLPIGSGQTISQPYVVAVMTEAVDPRRDDRMLEIGTGSGYGAAILSRIVSGVVTVERHERLAREAADRLRRLGYDNVAVHRGDGSRGWPDDAPYDGILVTAAGAAIPGEMKDQLVPGGRIVMPVGSGLGQELIRFWCEDDGREHTESLGAVQFVPLVGAE